MILQPQYRHTRDMSSTQIRSKTAVPDISRATLIQIKLLRPSILVLKLSSVNLLSVRFLFPLQLCPSINIAARRTFLKLLQSFISFLVRATALYSLCKQLHLV